MSFKTEKQANEFLEKEYQQLFNTHAKLNLLSVVKTVEGYMIESNIKIPSSSKNSSFFKKISSKINSFFQPNPNNNFASFFVVKKGSDFKTANGNLITPGSTIRNLHRSEKGTLGLNFKIKNTNDYYLLSNEHVLGKVLGDDKDPIVYYSEDDNPIIEENKIIATYHWGDIFDDADIAIAKYNDTILTTTSKNHLFLKKTTSIDSSIIIKNNSAKIVSRNAYVKIKDDYFYSSPRILKNQILTSRRMFEGDSGAIALSEDKKEAIGLLFAINNNYSVLNNINTVFNKIIESGELGQIDISDIEIIN